MDTSRAPRTSEPPSAFKPGGGYAPPSDPFSGERFSVREAEQQVRQRSRERDFSTSRSRRAQRREAGGNDKVLWLTVFVIAIGYAGYVAYSELRYRRSPPPAAEPPAADSAVASVPAAAPASIAPVALPPEAPPAAGVDVPVEPVAIGTPVNLAVLTDDLKKSLRLHEEARRFARERRFGEADDRFAAAVALTPHRFDVLFDWGQALIEQKRWATARDHLAVAVAADPTSVPARLALAQCAFQLRQYPDALALATWVVESEPYSEPAHQIAADVLTGMEQYDVAIRHLEKLVALNSNNHVAENSLGAVHLRLGRYAQAVRAFENVIRDEPGNSQAYYYLAQCFVQKNEPALAVDVLIRASSRFGRDFVGTWTKGPEFAALAQFPAFQENFGAPAPASATP
jgi:tetratricopeptide (TPR) repeat protein